MLQKFKQIFVKILLKNHREYAMVFEETFRNWIVLQYIFNEANSYMFTL